MPLLHIICDPNKLCKLSVLLFPRLIRSYWDCCDARSLSLMVRVILCAPVLPLLVVVPCSYLMPLCQPLHTHWTQSLEKHNKNRKLETRVGKSILASIFHE